MFIAANTRWPAIQPAVCLNFQNILKCYFSKYYQVVMVGFPRAYYGIHIQSILRI